MTEELPNETLGIIQDIASFLHEYRLQSGLSQKELSQKSGIHANTVSNLEAGKSFSILTLIEITTALDLPLRELFWNL